MKKQTNFDLESIDSTPSISVSSNLSAPFLSTGIINVDQILEVANMPMHVQFKLLISHICLNVKTNLQRIQETNLRGGKINSTLLEDLYIQMRTEMFKIFEEVEEI